MTLPKETLDNDRVEQGLIPLDLEKLRHDSFDHNAKTTLASSHPFTEDRTSITSAHKGGFPRLSTVSKSWKHLLFFLLPTFIQSHYLPCRTGQKRPLHPTAWLDGMRGVAAFCVFMDHLSYSNHDTYTAYGYESSNYEFFKLPFLRFLYTGASQVAIFFVVSGFALSYKPVKQMRNGEREGLLTTLSSSVFRRAIRLYLPCVASTLLVILWVRLGLYEVTRDFASNDKLLTGRREHHPFRYETLSKQLSVWAVKMWNFFNPFDFNMKIGDGALDIDGHLWTIPVEFVSFSSFSLSILPVLRIPLRTSCSSCNINTSWKHIRASIVLYLSQLGLSRLKPTIRILTLIALILYVLRINRWELFLFYAGFALCELDFRRRSSTTASTSSPLVPISPALSTMNKPSRTWSTIYLMTFVLGLYFGSQPARDLQHAPGWRTLSTLIPSHINPRDRYFPNLGAILLIWSTSSHQPLQSIFTHPITQYLGKISYPLYLMHGAVIHTLGYGIMDFMWSSFGRDTVLKKEIGFGVAVVWVVIVVVWMADLFMRVVDTPTVRFAKWLEEKCIMKT
ncbi:hypothetical protein E4T48_02286 [Aureobasidium sp. EXF-10727]|nr:hypothetical protein E4T48_02286 [Aureobasidium sp. EXF-10727]KAI4731232.1 hypothetical protein E4T49_01038 [Aureobasidium sp. EXF-10728]